MCKVKKNKTERVSFIFGSAYDMKCLFDIDYSYTDLNYVVFDSKSLNEDIWLHVFFFFRVEFENIYTCTRN